MRYGNTVIQNIKRSTNDEKLQNRLKLNAVLYYQIFRESIIKLCNNGLKTDSAIHKEELSIAGIEENEYLTAINNVIAHI